MSYWGENVRALAFCASSEDLCSYSSIRALSTHTSKIKKKKDMNFNLDHFVMPNGCDLPKRWLKSTSRRLR